MCITSTAGTVSVHFNDCHNAEQTISSTENNVDFLVKIRKSHHENPFVGYLNINSLRNKIISLREILVKAPIDILCTGETKLDDSFPDAQFIENYHFPPFRKDRNSNCGGKMVFIRKELIAKQIKHFQINSTETICIELIISKKEMVHYFHL